MLIQKYKITKSISIRKKEFKIIVSSLNEKIEYNYSGDDVFSGDYWNSLFIGNELFDLNFYKYPNYRLSLYPVKNNETDFKNGINI